MTKALAIKLTNVLKGEAEYIKRTEEDKTKQLEKLTEIYHVQQIINNFDKLEPVIARYINKKAEKERFER